MSKSILTLGEFLLKNDEQKKRLYDIFKELPKKGQNKIIGNLKKHSTNLFEYLNK